MSSRLGLDPDLTEILAIVSDDEKLVATLKEPAVREVLKDEATRAELNRPRWARAVELFAGRAFDVKSTREFASPFSWNTGAEYATLAPGERDYYRDHLLFRQAQALEAIDAKLARLLDQGDRDGRTLAVGFRGALELLEEIAGDDEGDDEPDPAGAAVDGDGDDDELGEDEPEEAGGEWIGPDGEPVEVAAPAGGDDDEPDDDALRDAVEGPSGDDSEAA